MTNKLNMLGWVAAAAFGGILLGGGFQTVDVKLAVVDFASVVEKSEFYSSNQKNFDTMQQAREALLQFLFQYKVATPEQAQRLRDLTIKDNLSGPEKTEMEKIKSDIKDSDKDKQAIIQKSNPTLDETNRLKSYQDRGREMDQTLAQWRDEFESDLRKRFQTMQQTAVDRAKTAVATVGKQGSYGIVFRADVAPYGSNDITDAVLKAMNAIK